MSRTRLTALLALVALTGFITTLDNTVVNVALPTIQRELGLSVTGLEWVASSYVLVFGAFLLPGGRLGDLFGRRRVLAVGLIVFTAASAAAAFAQDGATLIAARSVQGSGAALVIPATLAVIAADLPERRRAPAIGLWTAALAVALACGPAVGGLITQHWGWSWVFLLNVPCGALALALSAAVPPAREQPHAGLLGRLDLPGIVLSALAPLLLTYALVRGGEDSFQAAPVPYCLAGAALCVLVLIGVERRAPQPLVELDLLGTRSLGGGALAQVLWGIGVNGVFFFTALYLQRLLGFTPTEAGLAFLPLALALLAVTPFAERAAGRAGVHRSVAAGLLLVAGGLWWVSDTGAGASRLDLQPGLLLIGVGSALTAPLTVCAVAGVPEDRTGMASGLISAAREISGVFGVVLVGAVLSRRQTASLHAGHTPDEAFLDGYHLGLRLAAGCVVLGALVTWYALRENTSVASGRGRRSTPEEGRSEDCRPAP
ncbi:MFS transporter [Streptomyces sp. NPDC049590]|uniref:MFS transporter n=1 Tax=Streptomyces sp. NPDC049590 TaxID=3154834 RepID=UPI00341E383B